MVVGKKTEVRGGRGEGGRGNEGGGERVSGQA